MTMIWIFAFLFAVLLLGSHANAQFQTTADLNLALGNLSNYQPGVLIDFSRTWTCSTFNQEAVTPNAALTFIPSGVACGASFGIPGSPSTVNTMASVQCQADGSAVVTMCGTQSALGSFNLPEALKCNLQINTGLQVSPFGIYRSQCRGLFVLDNRTSSNCSQPSSLSRPLFIRSVDYSVLSYSCFSVNGNLPMPSNSLIPASSTTAPPFVSCTNYGQAVVQYCNFYSSKFSFTLPNNDGDSTCAVLPRDAQNPFANGGLAYRTLCGPAVSSPADSIGVISISGVLNLNPSPPGIQNQDSRAYAALLPGIIGQAFVNRLFVSSVSYHSARSVYASMYIVQNSSATQPTAEAVLESIRTSTSSSAWIQAQIAAGYMLPGTTALISSSGSVSMSNLFLCLANWIPPDQFNFLPSPELCPPNPQRGSNPMKVYSATLPGLYFDSSKTLTSCPSTPEAAYTTFREGPLSTFVPTNIACNKSGPSIGLSDYWFSSGIVNRIANVTCNLDGSVSFRSCSASPDSPVITLPAAPVCGFHPVVGAYRTQCQGVLMQGYSTDRCWNRLSKNRPTNMSSPIFTPSGQDSCRVNPSGMRVTCQADGSAAISPCQSSSPATPFTIPATPVDQCFATSLTGVPVTLAAYCGKLVAPTYVEAVVIVQNTNIRPQFANDTKFIDYFVSQFPSTFGGRLSVFNVSLVDAGRTRIGFLIYGTSLAPITNEFIYDWLIDDNYSANSTLNQALRAYPLGNPLSAPAFVDKVGKASVDIGFVCNLTTPAFKFVLNYDLCPSYEPKVQSVETSLKVNVDLTAALNQSFQTAFIKIVASSLKIDVSQISIVNVAAGSVVITLRIAAVSATGTTTSNPVALAQQLNAMASNATSPFAQTVQQALGVSVDPSYVPPPPAPILQCPDGSLQAVCPASPSSPASRANSQGLSGGSKAGIGVGVTLALIVVGAVAFWWYQKQSNPNDVMKQKLAANIQSSSSSDVQLPSVIQPVSVPAADAIPMPATISSSV